MPSPQKVKWAQLRVGIVAAVAMIIAAVLIFLLTGNGSIFTRTAILRTYLDDSAGMAEGSPVRLNGILVGSIEKVALSGERVKGRIVVISMRVKRDYLVEIPTDSKAGISASNLLGDKYINITKGILPDHVKDGDTVESLQVQDIPELMAQSSSILFQFQNILGRVDNILKGVEGGHGNIGKLIKDEELYNRVDAIAGDVQTLVTNVQNSKGTISKLLYDDGLYNDIRKPVQRLDSILNDLQRGKGTAGKLLSDDAVYVEARQTLDEAKTMLDGLNRGQGTAGKLLKDEELYKQVNLIMAKLTTVVDKLSSGQGTLGQLIVNPQLYDSLNGATREVQSLVQDMHKNPKRFLTIQLKLF
jgi:phospholipid/cholesterol/gamma-HCH transport system substrate-binding protein